MDKSAFDVSGVEIAWCPGCGNFGLRHCVMNAFAALGLDKQNLVMVSGIGQAAKAPQFLDVSYFNGLHGRALPAATGIKAANPGLTVVVESGDGDLYGEGGNHFLHAIRRNPDLTVIAHDNMVYGLTKGQAAPTSQRGMKTPVQVNGVISEPINPVALAIALGATFVAQGAAGEPALTQDLIQQAIRHKGFALVNVFQACPSFNKLNTHPWFKENTRKLDETFDPADKTAAMKMALATYPWPLGVLYREVGKPTFEEQLPLYAGNPAPLYRRERSLDLVKDLLRGHK
jgi:2-oxoglutarate/2-oxoacid ferredoxin oxidoreductase subunit beta